MVHGIDGLSDIYDEWRNLVEQLPHAHYNQHPDWYMAYLEVLQPDIGKVCFVTARQQGQLVGVLPLMRALRGDARLPLGLRIRRAELAHDTGIYTTDMVVVDVEQAPSIWQAISHSLQNTNWGWDVFYVNHGVLPQGHLHAALVDQPNVVLTQQERCWLVELAPWAQIEARLKRRFRQNLRRSRRLLEKVGAVRAVWVTNPADIASAFEQFVAMELASWKGQTETAKPGYPPPAAIGLEAWKQAFYLQVLERFAERGVTQILQLYAGDRLVGTRLSLQLGSTEYLVKSTKDEQLDNAIGVGHLMIEELIKRCEAQNLSGSVITELNCQTGYSWFEPWATSSASYVNVCAYNSTLAGRAAALVRWVRGIE